MFMTTLPGRIVGAKKLSLEESKTAVVGDDGYAVWLKPLSDGIIISEAQCLDSNEGYLVAGGEVIKFSGTATITNSSSATATVCLLIFDTV